MVRRSYNGLKSTLGAPLTSGATTVTFSAPLTHSGAIKTPVPTLTAPDYISLSILDEAGDLSEIVYVTGYAAGATTAVVLRGQEGSSSYAHEAGAKAINSPAVRDVGPPGLMRFKGEWAASLTETAVINFENGNPGFVPNQQGYPQIIDAPDPSFGTSKAAVFGPDGQNYANFSGAIPIVTGGNTSDIYRARVWVQSEGNYDFARLYIDGGQPRAQLSGVQGGFVTLEVSGVTPGEHSLILAYTSDNGSNPGFGNARWGSFTYLAPAFADPYLIGHVVSRGGHLYISKVDGNSTEPGVDPSWMLLGA